LVGLLIYLGLQDLLGRELAQVGTKVPTYAVFFAVPLPSIGGLSTACCLAGSDGVTYFRVPLRLPYA
jgi:hypothetical protein